MEQVQLLSGLFFANVGNVVGFAVPLLVEIINRDIKSQQIRFLVTVGVCLLVAVLLNWSKLLYGSVEELLETLTLIFMESQVVFKLYFKDSAIRQSMQRTGAVSTN